MKLTYCSFVELHTRVATAAVIDGHYENNMDAYLACQGVGIFTGDAFADGEFLSWSVPDSVPLFQNYIDNRNRHITYDEARVLFEARFFSQWDAAEVAVTTEIDS